MLQLQNKHRKNSSTITKREVFCLRLSSESGKSSLGTLLSLILIFGAVFFAVHNLQNIKDWYALRNYQAPTVVSQLADQDSMTPYGRKIFYVNHPSLDEKDLFSTHCPVTSREQSIVLGCYHGNQAGIFLLKVTDERLNGVHQVTAAHEMLHGAYDRLGGSKKSEVDAMLQDFYANGLKDDRVKKTIDAYRKSEPNDVVNEMHSIFGTEVAVLPAGLESYYKQYFVSRQAVTNYSAKYQAAFTSRQDAVDNYDKQLTSLKARIDQATQALDAKQGQIDSGRSNLDQLRRSGNTSEYNAGVPVYNALVDSYNADIHEAKALINEYNDIVARRNAIAGEQDKLVDELKGKMTTINQ